MTEVIHFYSANERWFEFSNFARYSIRLEGETWPTSEHYFQAQKMVRHEDREAVRGAKTPRIAARIGRDRSREIRPDWEAVKVDVMRTAVRAKFTQHAELGTLLLSTGDAKLVEHTDSDSYWGDGGDGSGHNWLGRILMEIREELREGR